MVGKSCADNADVIALDLRYVPTPFAKPLVPVRIREFY